MFWEVLIKEEQLLKKICCVLFCMWMVFTFAGCVGNEDSPPNLHEEDTTTQQQQSAASLTTQAVENSTTTATHATVKSVYFCWMDSGTGDPVITPIPDIDIAKFNALAEFYEQNAYDAVGSNNLAKTRRLPYSASNEPEIRFIKQESNGSATKYAAGLHVWEGKLVLEWYTSGDDYMVALDVPDDLSQYFIGIVNALALN